MSNYFSNYQNESIYERNGKVAGSDIIRDITPYSWLNDSGSMEVYDYTFGAENPWTLSNNIDSTYYNIRFPNKSIKWSVSSPIRIYRVARSAVGNTSLRSIIPDL